MTIRRMVEWRYESEFKYDICQTKVEYATLRALIVFGIACDCIHHY